MSRVRKVHLKRGQETAEIGRVSHFAQAECPLAAFCLCTAGLDAVQMDDTDFYRWCKLSGGESVSVTALQWPG